MTQFSVILDKSKLDWTVYFEYLKGSYKWNLWVDGSLYLEEDTQLLIDKILSEALSGYDYYSMSTMHRDQYNTFLVNLSKMKREIDELEDVEKLKKMFDTPKHYDNYIDTLLDKWLDAFKSDFNIFYLDLTSRLKETFDEYDQINIMWL